MSVAQAPSKPQFYVYHRLPGDTAWQWRDVAIEAPLQLTRDATGAHPSLDPKFAPSMTAGQGIVIMGNTIEVEDAVIPRYMGSEAARRRQRPSAFLAATSIPTRLAADCGFCKATNTWQEVGNAPPW